LQIRNLRKLRAVQITLLDDCPEFYRIETYVHIVFAKSQGGYRLVVATTKSTVFSLILTLYLMLVLTDLKSYLQILGSSCPHS
jgi:hypothetical protein